jgi:hypothetical protein
MKNKQSGILLFLLVLGGLSMHIENALATSILQCANENCLRSSILELPLQKYSENDCSKFKNKYSDSVYEENMELLCRLFIARDEASRRTHYPCIYEKSLNPDYSMDLSDIPLWFYSDTLYASLPKVVKPESMPDVDAYNNSTTFATYDLARTWEQKQEEGVIKYKFDIFVCRARENNQTFYIPYFIAFGKAGPIVNIETYYRYTYTWLEYVKVPPLQNIPVLRQIPISEFSDRHELYLLFDFDGDGSQDYAFVDAHIPQYYQAGVCLYQKNAANCKLILADKKSVSNIIQAVPNLQIIKKNMIITVKDKYKVEKPEKFTYKYENSKLKQAN